METRVDFKGDYVRVGKMGSFVWIFDGWNSIFSEVVEWTWHRRSRKPHDECICKLMMSALDKS